MGLDGISISQLRNAFEQSPKEYGAAVLMANNSDNKAIAALSNGQRVDPDKQSEKQEHAHEDSDGEKKEDKNIEEEVIKYDLSDSEKYLLEVDDENNVLIIEKKTRNVIQKINSQELSRYVSFLSNSNGSIVNRRF